MMRRLVAHAGRRRRWPPPALSPAVLSSAANGPAPLPVPSALAVRRRGMSDNLLGHSPMAPKVPASPPPPRSPGSSGPSFGVDANMAGGGVWAQTSAKRDKLAELRLELDWSKGQRTLDDVATPEQRLDLHLADGLRLVAKAVDGAWDADGGEDGAPAEGSGGSSGDESSAGGEGGEGEAEAATADADAATAERRPGLGPSPSSHPLLLELDRWLTRTESSRGADAALTKDHFDAHLSEAIRILSPHAGEAVPPRPPPALAELRDFAEYNPDPSAAPAEGGAYVPPEEVDADLSRAVGPFDDCVRHLRLLAARAAASHLRGSWDDLTAVTDSDVDRAAVRGEEAERRLTVPLGELNRVLRSFAFGTCADRTAALWDLADRDGDGMLDQAEMDAVVLRGIRPVEAALREMFAEALEATGVRDVVPSLEESELARSGVVPAPPAKKGWRQRRREAKEKKLLLKMFDRTIANHFDVEVETPHRLRCIYAWADKSHQDGKVDSVLVDSGTIAGRKRYVELHPKISLGEFREVQREHFGHSDRVGEEILSSFREDLLVRQGKGRQNRELRRDTALFLGVVSLIDAGILML